jgi:uncharacterized protein (TIGR03067 family)
VNLKGQTFEEAEKTVTKQLTQILRQPEVSITLGGWRKERKPTPKENETIQKANASKTSSGRGVKTSDVNVTLAPPLLQPTQGTLLPGIPDTSLVPVLPGLPPTVRGIDLSTNTEKKADGQKLSPAPTVSPAVELKTLQGRWKVVNIEKEKDLPFVLYTSVVGGSGTNPRVFPLFQNDQFFFRQNGMEILDFQNWIFGACFYRVDPTTSPKTIDLYRSRFTDFSRVINTATANKEDLTALGIYKIYEKDPERLKISLVNYISSLNADQRPKDFAVQPGSENMIITLERYHPSADEKAIQGKWDIINQMDDGKAFALETGPNNRNNFYFSDYLCNTYYMNNQRVNSDNYRYILDPDKNPKTIKLYPNPLNGRGSPNRETSSGIYKFDGERLWVAFRVGTLTPDKFESAPGSGVTLLELQRSEPKKEEQAEVRQSDKNISAESAEQKKTREEDEKNK